MNALIIITIFGLACSMVVGEDSGLPGGYFSVGPDDKDDVDLCRAKIINDLQAQEDSTNCHKVVVTPQKETVLKQVANGMNYKFEMTVLLTTTCGTNTNCCVKQGGETKTCTAIVHKSRDASEGLTYVENHEAKCS